MDGQILNIIATVVVTSGMNLIITTAALRTSIKFIEKDLLRLDSSVTRLHARIDEIQSH